MGGWGDNYGEMKLERKSQSTVLLVTIKLQEIKLVAIFFLFLFLFFYPISQKKKQLQIAVHSKV